MDNHKQTCHNCQESGHISRNCRRPMGFYRCINCSRSGSTHLPDCTSVWFDLQAKFPYFADVESARKYNRDAYDLGYRQEKLRRDREKHDGLPANTGVRREQRPLERPQQHRPEIATIEPTVVVAERQANRERTLVPSRPKIVRAKAADMAFGEWYLKLDAGTLTLTLRQLIDGMLHFEERLAGDRPNYWQRETASIVELNETEAIKMITTLGKSIEILASNRELVDGPSEAIEDLASAFETAGEPSVESACAITAQNIRPMPKEITIDILRIVHGGKMLAICRSGTDDYDELGSTPVDLKTGMAARRDGDFIEIFGQPAQTTLVKVSFANDNVVCRIEKGYVVVNERYRIDRNGVFTVMGGESNELTIEISVLDTKFESSRMRYNDTKAHIERKTGEIQVREHK